MSKPLGPNPLAHIIKRQEGIINYDFRINLFRERLKHATNLYKKDLISHFGCVNAIEFSKEGEYLVSGGDDRRVLLWHVEKAMTDKSIPKAMEKQHQSNIFCLGFNSDNSHIFSGGNDDTVMLHDTKTGDIVDIFLHEKPVFGLSIDPLNDKIFSSAGEDGKVLLFDLRVGSEVMCIAKYKAPFHAVMFHPMDGGFVITANAKEGAGLWDLRRPKSPVIRYSGENAAQNCMSVRFNTLGTSIVALRRRLPPILYSTFSETPVCQFYHSDYYNSCTMKSCCFAGEMDEYVLSGSDDFNLYIWRITDADPCKTEQWIDSSQMVLNGHRSIVNQVRYNSQKCVIASSGVEKVIKLWTPFDLDGWNGNLTGESVLNNQRPIYSQDEYLTLMNISIQNMTHDFANQNTNEDPRMMAFFDSLIQQEIEAWHSSATSDSDQSTQHTSDNSSMPTSEQTSDSSIEDVLDLISARDYFRSDNGLGNSMRFMRKKTHRSKYPNRIAYLIATKRNSLKRLAMRGTGYQSNGRKYRGRKNKRINLRSARNIGGKRNTRYNSKKIPKRPSSREPNSDSDGFTPKFATKRRAMLHHVNTSIFHPRNSSYRNRQTKINNINSKSKSNNISNSNSNLLIKSNKRKLNNNSSLTSSDDDDDDDTVPIVSRTSNNIINSSRNVNLDNQPSTSTGITENGKGTLFRLAHQEIDSDDDQSINNSPSRNYDSNKNNVSCNLNGNHRNKNSNNIHNNNNRNHNDIYSSHSNSRLSNSSYQEDGTSNDSLSEYFTKRKKIFTTNGKNSKLDSGIENLTNTIEKSNVEEDDDDNSLFHNSTTPHKTRELFNQTPDSGIATTACSSSSSMINNNNVNNLNGVNYNSNEKTTPSENSRDTTKSLGGTAKKIFNQKILGVRRNYRNHFCFDSDSD